MTRDELRAKAASRRNTAEVVPEKVKATWKCSYCQHDFKSEVMYEKHSCVEKRRAEQLRSPIGQAAFSYYNEWQRAKKQSMQKIETFAESRHYTTFIKFAEWAIRTNLPNVPAFIRLMVERDNVSPTLWARDNTYAMYLKSYDAAVDPNAQFLSSLNELKELARELKVPLSEVFEALGVDTIEQLVKKRKLSHWFLLASRVFRAYLMSLPAQDKDKLTNAIQAGAAVGRITEEQEMFGLFGAATKEVGL